MRVALNNESKLLSLARKGDKAAFREIMETHKKKIFYLAYDLTGSMQDAEDLCQETFFKAYRNLPKFRGEAAVGSWLYRITLNTFLDQKKKISFQEERKQMELGEHESSLERPENVAESRQIQIHIDQALEKLTPRERSIFVMRHYQGMPVKQVASILNISDGTVKSLLFRAIRKLQKELDHYNQNRGKEVYQ